MESKLSIVFIFFLLLGIAQAQPGIQFQQGLTWTQIKDKAKAENKYIFVDAYATWCIPCRIMDQNIFPQPNVGTFFNTHFINIKVQMDVTKKDNEEIKSWYQDAKLLLDTYKIDSYPTYLFFNPDGTLVHRLWGAYSNAEEFIEQARLALNPATQYVTLKRAYEAGRRDSDFLLSFIRTVEQTHDLKFLPVVINEYLKTQKDLLKKENIKFILTATFKSTDPGFPVLRDYPDKVDAIAGKGKSAARFHTIVFDEILLPNLRNGGTKMDYGGGMVVYSGELNQQVDWAVIRQKTDKLYPGLSDEIIAAAKPVYYEWLGNWPKFVESVSSFSVKYEDKISADQLNAYAWTVFSNCNESAGLNEALKWSVKALENGNENNLQYLGTYAGLLYKTGKKEQAITVLEKAIKLSGQASNWFTQTLDKVKKR